MVHLVGFHYMNDSKETHSAKFNVKPSIGSHADRCGQTDGHVEADRRFFCDSAAAPKTSDVVLFVLNYNSKATSSHCLVAVFVIHESSVE